jgi:hypothetical protein
MMAEVAPFSKSTRKSLSQELKKAKDGSKGSLPSLFAKSHFFCKMHGPCRLRRLSVGFKDRRRDSTCRHESTYFPSLHFDGFQMSTGTDVEWGNEGQYSCHHFYKVLLSQYTYDRKALGLRHQNSPTNKISWINVVACPIKETPQPERKSVQVGQVNHRITTLRTRYSRTQEDGHRTSHHKRGNPGETNLLLVSVPPAASVDGDISLTQPQ